MSEIEWRKASRSGQGANCVEVALLPDRVLVRDSKNPDAGVLAFDLIEWRALVAQISDDELDC